MSDYDYDDRHRSRRSRYKEPEYVSETTYVERGNAPVRDLVYRPREDSIEDIPRDFPPPGAEYRRTKYKETYGPRARSSRGYDDDYSDYTRRAPPRGRDDGYYSDDYERPRHHRRKSVGDHLKDLGEDLGIGGVVAAVAGHRSRSKSRHRSDRSERDRDDRDSRYESRSRSRSGDRHRSGKKWEQAAKAAIVAGAVEAFRSRKEPGPWTGAKGQRIATAALGAAGIDGLVDKDPGHHSKRHIVESAIGGLAAARLANGPRSRSQSRGRAGSRSRSQSRSRSIFGRSQSRGRERSKSRLREVAGAGAALAAGKAIYDRIRSKSRSRKDRSRSRSSSRDSYEPPRGRRYDRSRGFDDSQQRSDRKAAGTQDDQNGKRDSSSSSESTTDMENRRKKMRGKEILTAAFATAATIHAGHGVYSSMVASEKRRKLVKEGEMSAEDARKRKSKNMLQDAASIGIAALGIKSAFSEWKEMTSHRHEIKELEKKRRERRKLRERRERERQQQGYMNPMTNPYFAYPAPVYPTTYNDGNPYGAVAFPPPPIGAPPPNRY